MDPAIYELLVNQSRPLVLEPWSLPMLVSPKPWLTYNYGGYLLHSTNCVRLKVRYLYSFFSCRLGQAGDIHLDRLQTQDEKGTLHRILSGLDVLGQTAWKVNNNILSVVEKVQELNDKDSLLTAKDSITTSLTESVFDDFPEMHSSLEIKWEQHFKIEVAKLFSNLTFYLPHSLDFRGRAYPIAPYLSVVGDDLSRGLLLYGQGKKLGTQGWYWLRVHLANTAGYSKGKTYAERVQYTDKHLEDILDSANHPLTGRQWWKNCGTSTPWQCLAACFEIRDALLEENPVDYISHLPISQVSIRIISILIIFQDGSCNGFQHYAALGKDTEGAYAVNLIPSRDTNRTILREHQRPQDIYLHVARCVSTAVADEAARYRQQRLEDASTLQDSSNSDSSHISEILCQKISSRSLYKRIVMTSVYGVTPYTARIHLTEYLLQENIVPPNRIIEASLYLVNKIFEALYSSLFQRAKYIQDWLTTVATEIGRSVPPNSPLLNPYSSEAITYPQTFLSWTTPLGFQVTQPYILPLPSEQHKTGIYLFTPHLLCSSCLLVALQKISFARPYSSYFHSSSSSTSSFPPVDILKQSSSFPPNFIHSLDATHMFLTALACYNDANLTSFAAVHDSYYSHASDYHILQDILKQQFIQLYSQPILQNLRQELIEKYQGYKIPLHDVPTQPSPARKPEKISEYYKQNRNIFRKYSLSWRNRRKVMSSAEERGIQQQSWRDISFPPVPTCGNLNISHVAMSEYFFN